MVQVGGASLSKDKNEKVFSILKNRFSLNEREQIPKSHETRLEWVCTRIYHCFDFED